MNLIDTQESIEAITRAIAKSTQTHRIRCAAEHDALIDLWRAVSIALGYFREGGD